MGGSVSICIPCISNKRSLCLWSNMSVFLICYTTSGPLVSVNCQLTDTASLSVSPSPHFHFLLPPCSHGSSQAGPGLRQPEQPGANAPLLSVRCSQPARLLAGLLRLPFLWRGMELLLRPWVPRHSAFQGGCSGSPQTTLLCLPLWLSARTQFL